jgi:FkbM family methyltransferase
VNAVLKSATKRFLQRSLGFERYLYWFAVFRSYRPVEPEYRLFLEMIRPTGTFLDLGANLGITAVLAHRRHPQMKIVAVEPAPDNLVVLRRICSKFRMNAQIEPIALGAAAGEVQMVLPVVDGVLMQGLSHVLDPKLQWYNDGHTFTARMATLDSLEPLNVCALKLDVENFESQVLEGGRKTLLRDKPPIFCELWPNEYRARTLQVAASLGYRPFVFQDGRLAPFDNQEILHFVLLASPSGLS